MKLLLKSKQYYGTHEDEINEEFDCTIEKLPNPNGGEDITKINFENGYIQIEENKIIHERGENKLVIEKNNNYEVDYDTEHGMIVLDLKGIEVKKYKDREDGLIASAKYEIRIVGIEPYINEMDIYLS